MSSLAARRMARRPALEAKLLHMSQTLHPLVNNETGITHRHFPLTIFQFWLLTDEQLDGLASFYHQRTPSRWSKHYPCPISWPRIGLTLEDKRRKFGRFIGLRGCETPRRLTDRGRPVRSTRAVRTCRGNCRMTWDDGAICMPCSMRKIDKIFAGGNILSSDGMDVEIDADMDMDIDMNVDDCESTSDERYYTAPESKPLTIDDIIENAQRARLEANTGEEIMRRKTGHY